jgi:multisubunit Na+/H+ antiporter MnhG subunit
LAIIFLLSFITFCLSAIALAVDFSPIWIPIVLAFISYITGQLSASALGRAWHRKLLKERKEKEESYWNDFHIF